MRASSNIVTANLRNFGSSIGCMHEPNYHEINGEIIRAWYNRL